MLIKSNLSSIDNDLIRKACAQVVPWDSQDRIISLINDEIMHLWVDNVENTGVILMTTVVYDVITDTNSLLIYLLFSESNVSKDAWFESFDTLKQFAVEVKCRQIIFYTLNQSLAKIAIKVNGKACAFVYVPVGDK
jgi:hypothetical protein